MKFIDMANTEAAYTFKCTDKTLSFVKDHYHCWLTNFGQGFRLEHVYNHSRWHVDIINQTIHEIGSDQTGIR